MHAGKVALGLVASLIFVFLDLSCRYQEESQWLLF